MKWEEFRDECVDMEELRDPVIRELVIDILSCCTDDERDEFPYLRFSEQDDAIEGANVSGGPAVVLILLSPRQLKEKAGGDRAVLRGLIAHELAHAFYRHPSTYTPEYGLAVEEEADAKAREWVGADVDSFRSRFFRHHRTRDSDRAFG